ncbi:uncharacterized protein LOC131288560 [Anopheles ziemanni]|uniref:uncharacterized protein LOC131259669 n=1 Tax=Anopheles coustani TaxID=139045 RepID=UPI002657E267|nr:uncharacterized protein LOC131259669 [Anopheles coustani]XP_058173687.1 uncharacterized protein LOC131288560 [Anopheles ziemanni]
MGLLQEIYCPEQIVIPQDFHNTLKQYAKAVIRTQPFDLLRWSAAYFRCLALNVRPPVKPRFESIVRSGALTKGIIRVLIDQLGKGYYVQKKILLEKWEGLCLPEEDLLNVLSLLRMLNWSQLHWLKIVAVFIGLLCNNLAGTAEMICEMLTEDPDGGAASVPLWMFQECFVAVADLDCGTAQKFVNGRKVLDEDTGALEEEHLPPTLPKVLSTISFKNAIIDKYRSVLEQEPERGAAPPGSGNVDDNGQLSQPSAVPSRLESDFKFLGDDTDVHEVLRRAPDFDSVIVLLKKLRTDEAQQSINVAKLSEAQLDRTRERSRQIEDLKATLSEEEYFKLKEQERHELLKAMGPPWLMLYLFSQDCSRTRSFNYVEQSSTSISDGSVSVYSTESIAEDDFEASLGNAIAPERRRKSSYCLPATVRARMSVSAHSAAAVANEVLSKVVCAIDQAIIDGECELSVGSISEFFEQKSNASDDFLSAADHERLQSFLKEAETRELAVNDLNELYNFFVSESFNCALQGNGRAQPADNTQEIFHIFGESGIEVDANLLEAKISDNMILGLVSPPPIDEPAPTSLPVVEQPENSTSVASEINRFLGAVSLSPPVEVPGVQEGTTQTEPIEIACRQRKKPFIPSANEHIAYKCQISPIPGIGAPLDVQLRDRLMEYLSQRAAEQQGLIYPRNFRETLCPKID